jgi:hypothetical protein
MSGHIGTMFQAMLSVLRLSDDIIITVSRLLSTQIILQLSIDYKYHTIPIIKEFTRYTKNMYTQSGLMSQFDWQGVVGLQASSCHDQVFGFPASIEIFGVMFTFDASEGEGGTVGAEVGLTSATPAVIMRKVVVLLMEPFFESCCMLLRTLYDFLEE